MPYEIPDFSGPEHDRAVAKLGDLAAEVVLRRVSMLAWRDLDDPEAGGSELHASTVAALWAEAGITNPAEEIDAAEIYVPFSWFEPMWLESLGFAEPGRGWRMTESGATARDGSLPVNPSGGALASNPMFSAGGIRVGEAAQRVWSGEASKVLAHATSGPALQQNLVCTLAAATEGAGN